MSLTIRRAVAGDAEALGRICFDAFSAIAGQHNFPCDFPHAGASTGVLASLIAHEGFFDAVAEIGGTIVGSNFLDERSPINGVGPITVDPSVQNKQVGQALMDAVLTRSRERHAAGIRLVQAGYHARSLALYLKLGFEVRAMLACVQGPMSGEGVPGWTVRPARSADIVACDTLYVHVHGHSRIAELQEAVAQGAARVVERDGRITGYSTAIAFFGHAVGEATDDLKALIAVAPVIQGAGVLVPAANGDLLRWCMQRGLRITQTLTLMSIGLYNEPKGAWLPSILY